MSQFDISLTDAQTKTQNFQTVNNRTNKGVSVPRNEILDLLNQSGCTGLRIYFALNSQTQPDALTVVIVGTQDNGSGDFRQAEDIVPVGTSTAKLKENAYPCPPLCNGFF